MFRKGALTMRNCLDLRGLPHRHVRRESTLRVDKVGSEDGVNEGRLSQSSLAYRQRKKESEMLLSNIPCGNCGRNDTQSISLRRTQAISRAELPPPPSEHVMHYW
jgi:hypothetical protein